MIGAQLLLEWVMPESRACEYRQVVLWRVRTALQHNAASHPSSCGSERGTYILEVVPISVGDARRMVLRAVPHEAARP
jgi:hypothetical protein